MVALTSSKWGKQIMDVLNPAAGRVSARKGNPSMPDSTGGSRRVVFTFDEGSFNLLQAMTRELGLGTEAGTIREALRIVRAIQKQAEEGYSDVIVENPTTLESRKLVIDFLERERFGPQDLDE
jgi:hypothetical protein